MTSVLIVVLLFQKEVSHIVIQISNPTQMTIALNRAKETLANLITFEAPSTNQQSMKVAIAVVTTAIDNGTITTDYVTMLTDTTDLAQSWIRTHSQ